MKKKAKYFSLVIWIGTYRNTRAIYIQKNFKRFITMKRYKEVLSYEKTLPSIKWSSSISNVKEIYIVGSMNKWNQKIKMTYCRLRRIYVKYIDGLKRGKDYEIKFIVDGSY